jgi:GxxExxY protein
MDDFEALIDKVVDCGFHLHRQVGPGLLESVYEAVFEKRLAEMGLFVERQKPIPVEIDGIAFGDAFRADLLIERRLLIELKSIDKLAPLHIKQTITYLRLLNFPKGLLINFGGETYGSNVKPIFNNFHRP